MPGRNCQRTDVKSVSSLPCYCIHAWAGLIFANHFEMSGSSGSGSSSVCDERVDIYHILWETTVSISSLTVKHIFKLARFSCRCCAFVSGNWPWGAHCSVFLRHGFYVLGVNSDFTCSLRMFFLIGTTWKTAISLTEATLSMELELCTMPTWSM